MPYQNKSWLLDGAGTGLDTSRCRCRSSAKIAVGLAPHGVALRRISGLAAGPAHRVTECQPGALVHHQPRSSDTPRRPETEGGSARLAS